MVCMCLRSCSSPCTDQSHTGLLHSSAGSDTWAACRHSGNSCHHSNTEPSRDHLGELWRMFPKSCGAIKLLQCGCFVCGGTSSLTDRRQCGGGQLHTCAVVQCASIGTGAHWSTGAQQTQPLTFLPVTWISHWKRQTELSVTTCSVFCFFSARLNLFTHSQVACSDGAKLYP